MGAYPHLLYSYTHFNISKYARGTVADITGLLDGDVHSGYLLFPQSRSLTFGNPTAFIYLPMGILVASVLPI